MAASSPRSRNIPVLLLTGALTSLGFAPFNLFFLPYLAFAVLFYHWLDAPPWQACKYGFVFGIGLFAAGVGWLYISISLYGGINTPAAILLTLLLVAFMALYPALAGYACALLRPDRPVVHLLLVMPAVWTLTEWLRSFLFTGFPWLSLGYSQIDTWLAGYAPVTGVFSLTWLMLVTAAALVAVVRADTRARSVLAGTVLILFVCGHLLQGVDWSEDRKAPVSVALVQGAIPQSQKWLPEMRQGTLDLYRSLTSPYWGSDIIIWPETAIPAYYHKISGFTDDLQTTAIQHDSILITGLPVMDRVSGRYYNSILALGKTRQFYAKRHLVPFGEYLPLQTVFGPLVRLLNIPIAEFSPGDRAKPPLIFTPVATLGMTICYEDVFAHETQAAMPAAELLVNVSNDAWFGNSAAPHQHLQMARMRALESGRYMLRGTNTGISAVIGPNGKILSRSRQFEADVITAEVYSRDGITPYTARGDYPLLLLLSFLLLAIYLAGRRRRARQPGP